MDLQLPFTPLIFQVTDNHTDNRKVYALGETVLDMVSGGDNTFRAIPGGSVLNAAVSLGRMGVDINLITEYGADKAGDFIENFLESNAVKTAFCARHAHHKTSLALAFLDKAKNASYTFYHDIPELYQAEHIPEIHKDDILLFGSYYAVKPSRRAHLLRILKNAVAAKSIIYYDLNIRKAHADDITELMPSYLNNISVASVVKGSDEDFYNLFGLSDPSEIYRKVSRYCNILIITNGSRPLQVFTPGYKKSTVYQPYSRFLLSGQGIILMQDLFTGLQLREFRWYRVMEFQWLIWTA